MTAAHPSDDRLTHRGALVRRPAWEDMTQALRAYQRAHTWRFVHNYDDGSSNWTGTCIDPSGASKAERKVLDSAKRLANIQPDVAFVSAIISAEISYTLNGPSFEPGTDCDGYSPYEPDGRPSSHLIASLQRHLLAGVSDAMRSEVKPYEEREQWAARFDALHNSPLPQWLSGVADVEVSTTDGPAPMYITPVDMQAFTALYDEIRAVVKVERAQLDADVKEVERQLAQHMAKPHGSLKQYAELKMWRPLVERIPGWQEWADELENLYVDLEIACHWSELGDPRSFASEALDRMQVEASRQGYVRAAYAQETGLVNLDHSLFDGPSAYSLGRDLAKAELKGRHSLTDIKIICDSAMAAQAEVVARDQQHKAQIAAGFEAGWDGPAF